MNFNDIHKVELHCHLEACFYLQTIQETANTLGLDVPSDIETFRREWLITEPMNDLQDALKKFAKIQSIWSSVEIIERLTYEACEYASKQGIKIFELRYSPDFIAKGHANLNFEKIHCAILKGIERATHLDIAIGLIGIVQKILPVREAMYTTDFIIENKASFVGIDLADMDIGFEIRRFTPVIEKARKAGLHVTIHSGEEDVPEAPQHVRVAIEELGAERIGHGIHVINDPEVIEFIKASNVLLEICPSSNWLTGSVVSIQAHPVRRLMEAGVHISINSDDPGIFDIDLCHEYELLHDAHGFQEEHFNRCNDIAAAHSFLPLEQKQKVWPRPIPQID